MISTGGNDLERALVAASAGTCGGEDQLDCFRDAVASMRASFDGIVTEIELLRNGRPTAIQLVTGVNEFLTDPGLIDAVGPAYAKTHGVAITKMLADVQCEVAAKHTAKCIDLGLRAQWPGPAETRRFEHAGNHAGRCGRAPRERPPGIAVATREGLERPPAPGLEPSDAFATTIGYPDRDDAGRRDCGWREKLVRSQRDS